MPTQDVKPPYGLQTSEAAQMLAHTVLASSATPAPGTPDVSLWRPPLVRRV
jgi:hypothetical protein